MVHFKRFMNSLALMIKHFVLVLIPPLLYLLVDLNLAVFEYLTLTEHVCVKYTINSTFL